MALDLKGSIARGGKAAEAMHEENKLPGGNFDRINWFKLEDNERKFYRFLDDANEWPSVYQHPFAPTRKAPDSLDEASKKSWPQQMSPVCRKTPEFVQFFPDGCYICDHMHEVRPNPRGKKSVRYYPQVRVWARAVEREEVRVQNDEEATKYSRQVGEILGYRDAEVEIDEVDAQNKPTGKKTKKKKIVFFNQSLKTFFSPLQGYADVYGTILDRDYSIQRKGSGLDTDYHIVPLNPITRADGTTLDMRTTPEMVNGEPTGRLLRDSYLDDAQDLFEVIEARLDDNFYHRFFDDRVAVPERQNDTTSSAPSSAPTSSQSASEPASQPASTSASTQATKDKLAAMRQRVRGDNPAASQPEGEEQPQEEPSAQPVAAASGPIDLS